MKSLKFAQLLWVHARRKHAVLARVYSNGSWHQFSGKDVCSHIYLATQYWQDIFHLSEPRKNLIFITSNSYHAFVGSYAAALLGYQIMWLPSQMSSQDIQDVTADFPCDAIVTDVEDYAPYWKSLNIPVIGIHGIIWMDREKYLEHNYEKFKILIKNNLGAFHFMSSGHDGVPKHEIINLNTFVLTAQNFIDRCDAPKNILWHSFEFMPPSHPFAHLSKFCALLKSGIVGFPNYGSDLETSFCILQPTYLFCSRTEFDQISRIVKMYSKQSSGTFQIKIKKSVYKMQKFLDTSKAMKIPEDVFSFLKKTTRKVSKVMNSNAFKLNGLDNLQFIVHGFTSASKKNVQLFENCGIPVIETYGTTHAAGMLSSNTFKTPHLNIMGTPLAHVYFRLGAHSTLEYKLSSDIFEDPNVWHETGDVVQMTPFGFILTGGKNKNP